MDMLELHTVNCPYCGESFETTIDLSAGRQQYIEDCYVCCRPIQFIVEPGFDGELASIVLRREDE